ncbi:MAG: GatB/YqeY domain-containing protein [Gammaproteobacteria bacterium]|nr:GatB/YqeY domain-containing protein [Gammaproteobacteria bacterium]
MTVKEHIQEDMKTAMRTQAKERLATIRLILAALKQREVDERITLTDADVYAILDKMVKQRRDSISQFETGGRSDLAEKEAKEIEVIQAYLPSQLSENEVNTMIEFAIKEAGAASMRDMGKVMAILKPQLQGRADIGAVSAKIKAKLPV